MKYKISNQGFQLGDNNEDMTILAKIKSILIDDKKYEIYTKQSNNVTRLDLGGETNGAQISWNK